MAAKANEGIKSHVYCAVKCRKCDGLEVLKYLGAHAGSSEYALPSSCPEILSVTCGSCDTRGRYTREEVEIIVLDYPPPSDFFPRFWVSVLLCSLVQKKPWSHPTRSRSSRSLRFACLILEALRQISALVLPCLSLLSISDSEISNPLARRVPTDLHRSSSEPDSARCVGCRANGGIQLFPRASRVRARMRSESSTMRR